MCHLSINGTGRNTLKNNAIDRGSILRDIYFVNKLETDSNVWFTTWLISLIACLGKKKSFCSLFFLVFMFSFSTLIIFGYTHHFFKKAMHKFGSQNAMLMSYWKQTCFLYGLIWTVANCFQVCKWSDISKKISSDIHQMSQHNVSPMHVIWISSLFSVLPIFSPTALEVMNTL